MELVKQVLTVMGVIGDVVDDFDPVFGLIVIYRDQRISMLQPVWPAQVHHRPTRLLYIHDAAHPEVLETFRTPTLITVVRSLNHISSLFFPFAVSFLNIFRQNWSHIVNPNFWNPYLGYDRSWRCWPRVFALVFYTRLEVTSNYWLYSSRIH